MTTSATRLETVQIDRRDLRRGDQIATTADRWMPPVTRVEVVDDATVNAWVVGQPPGADPWVILVVDEPLKVRRPVAGPTTAGAPEVAELLRGLRELADAYETAADAAKPGLDRARHSARSVAFRQAQRLAAAYLREGAGPFALGELLPYPGRY